MKNLLQTELPKRFTDAVSKLYNAFHKGELYAMDCAKCAVGNLVDNNSAWTELLITKSGDARMIEGKKQLQRFKDSPNILNYGYSAIELAQIENIFMFGCRLESNHIERPNFNSLKEKQFNGLCLVVQ